MQSNRKIVIILSHCDSDIKKEILMNNIKILRKIPDLDILLTSHIPLPQEMVEQFDYFVYDKSNPSLKWPVRAVAHWKHFNHENKLVKLSYLVDDYGWAVFNQINLGYNSISYKNYQKFIYINYDLLIDEDIISEINLDDDKSKLYHVKGVNGQESFPGLIFFMLNKNDIKNILGLIKLESYIKHENGEKYLESIFKFFSYKVSTVVSRDQIDYASGNNGKLINNSNSEDYHYFVEHGIFNKKDEKIFFFYNVKTNITLKNGEDIIEIQKDTTKLITTKNKLDILVDEKFEDLPFKDFNNEQFIEIL